MQVSRTVAAPRAALYAAFMSPKALVAWMPPSGMRGDIQDFDCGAGGGYRMTLTYQQPGPGTHGKTTTDADTVDVRFVELVPNARIIGAADFVSDDPANSGTMTMTWTFTEVPGGTEVSVRVENAPPGISEADHEAGIRSSLENLAAFVAR